MEEPEPKPEPLTPAEAAEQVAAVLAAKAADPDGPAPDPEFDAEAAKIANRRMLAISESLYSLSSVLSEECYRGLDEPAKTAVSLAIRHGSLALARLYLCATDTPTTS